MAASFTFPVSLAIPFDGSDAVPPFVSDNAQDAIIEARETAQGKARATIGSLHNGIMSNNFWIGYTENINSFDTPFVIPWNATLKEVSFSNLNDADGEIDFYKNGTTATEIIYTEIFTAAKTKIFVPDFTLVSGDLLRLRWKDTGTNPKDVAIMMFFVLD